MKWKDTTSYSRGERDTVEPRQWELDLGGLRVCVHRYHGLDGWFGTGWFGTCHAMGVERQQLDSTTPADAQQELLGYLKSRTERWVAKLNAALLEAIGLGRWGEAARVCEMKTALNADGKALPDAYPIKTPERDALEAEVVAIAAQLSPDELRVLRFQGKRMIRIGHEKYGPLDLDADRRSWQEEIAQEASDKLFYEACRDIAKADRRSERLRCFKADEDYALLTLSLDELMEQAP